jgi:hypothetical protein
MVAAGTNDWSGRVLVVGNESEAPAKDVSGRTRRKEIKDCQREHALAKAKV